MISIMVLIFNINSNQFIDYFLARAKLHPRDLTSFTHLKGFDKLTHYGK